MFASSAFVLAALTMTGIYMKSRNAESQDNGYTIDFTAMEESADNRLAEIAQNTETDMANMPEILEDDLDYTPMEVGSGLVEIPGLTDGIEDEIDLPQEELSVQMEMKPEEKPGEKPEEKPEEKSGDKPEESSGERTEETQETEEQQQEDAASQDVVVIKSLHFAEADGLLKPVIGETVIPYSMDTGTYFFTLDHYKCNPAVMIKAEEGAVVSACAEGRVIDIFENEEIGHAITMDLGDGYKITYGQLNGINVTLNSYVDPGEAIASVAAPTKYYSREGSNLYLMLTKDGDPVNPENLF